MIYYIIFSYFISWCILHLDIRQSNYQTGWFLIWFLFICSPITWPVLLIGWILGIILNLNYNKVGNFTKKFFRGKQ